MVGAGKAQDDEGRKEQISIHVSKNALLSPQALQHFIGLDFMVRAIAGYAVVLFLPFGFSPHSFSRLRWLLLLCCCCWQPCFACAHRHVAHGGVDEGVVVAAAVCVVLIAEHQRK